MAAVSIGALRVDAVLETKRFEKGTVVMRKELNAANRAIREFQTPVEKHNEKMARYRDLVDKGALSQKHFTEIGRRMTKGLLDTARAQSASNKEKMKAEAATKRLAAEEQRRIQILEKQRQRQERLNREVAKYAKVTRDAQSAQRGRLNLMFGGQGPGGQSGGMLGGAMTGAMAGRMGGAGGLGRLLGPLAAGLGIGQAGRFSLSSFMDVQQAEADFKVLAGSAEAGRRSIEEFRDLAARTPLEFPQVTKAARTLMSFGVAADQTTDVMRRLGEVSGGNSERFQSLALVYGQVAANQKLMGQDLLQFVNAGFNPLLEMSEKTGKSMSELRDEMSQGAITFDMVAEAIRSATDEGGRFNGRLDEMSKTLRGKLSILRSDLSKFGASVGSALAPFASFAADTASTGLRGYTAIGEALVSAQKSVGIIKRDQSEIQARLPYAVRDMSGIAEAARKWRRATGEIAKTKPLPGSVFDPNKDEADSQKIRDEIEALKDKNLVLQLGEERAAEFFEKRRINEMFASQAEKDRLRRHLEQNKELQKAKELEEERLQLVKMQEEKAKRQAELERQRQEARRRSMVEEALNAAEQKFADDERRREQQRKDIAQGPGTGEQSLASFMASQQNQAIADAVMPKRKTPGEAELLVEAKKQLAALQREEDRDKRRMQILERIAKASEDNKFKRIR